jgi:DNA modification methylase
VAEAPSARVRRSLSHVGGEVTTEGDAGACEALRHALDVASAPAPRVARDADAGGAPTDVGAAVTDDGATATANGRADATRPDDDEDRAHVHGFHAYPARMHPVTAARLVTAFSPRGGVVLDPFCGSGTVLVEAMLAGRNAVGTDLNPLAAMLATSKTERRDAEARARIASEARAIGKLADERRKARTGPSRRYPEADVALFEPHVLLELDSLRLGIERHEDAAVRRDLGLVLSAILVKVSRKQGDTSDRTAPRRLAAGYTTKLFVRKAAEYVARLDAFAAALPGTPKTRPSARVRLDDATALRTVRDGSIDAVVTSPPYAATYDYLAHHALRLRWLGLDARAFERDEFGARRAYARLSPDEARDAWRAELTRFLEAVARVVRPGGAVVLLVADSAVRHVALRANEIVLDVCRATPFFPVARASQARPHFHGPTAAAFARAPRAEHALYLRREAARVRTTP